MSKVVWFLLVFYPLTFVFASTESDQLVEEGARLTMGIDGHDIDFPKGLALIEEAAALNNPIAYYCLACFYLRGEGVPKDPTKARDYFYQSARLGYGAGQFNAGIMAKNGEGGPLDRVQAFIDLYEASENVKDLETLTEDARYYLDQVAAKMTPDEISQAMTRLKGLA